MTDVQLYVAIGVPVFAIIMAVVGGMFQFAALSARITSFESNINARFNSLESNVNSRFNSLENRFTIVEARFETLIGKVVEIDNRLTRVEAILERH